MEPRGSGGNVYSPGKAVFAADFGTSLFSEKKFPVFFFVQRCPLLPPPKKGAGSRQRQTTAYLRKDAAAAEDKMEDGAGLHIHL